MKRILIVDDEMMNRDLIAKVLKKEGFQSDEASNGFEALERLKVRPYDLVLMDLMMPEMDGFDAIQVIRDELQLAMPIITVTALGDEAAISKALELGADGYLLKPFDLPTMVKTVKEALPC